MTTYHLIYNYINLSARKNIFNPLFFCNEVLLQINCELKICVISKQWLLAGKFSEFEYSRETCRFWRVRVLAKTAVF